MRGGLLLLLVLVFICVPLKSEGAIGEYDKFYQALSREAGGKAAPDYSMESIQERWELKKKRANATLKRFFNMKKKIEAIIDDKDLDRGQRNARLLALKKSLPKTYRSVMRLYLRKKRHGRKRASRLARFRRRLKDRKKKSNSR